MTATPDATATPKKVQPSAPPADILLSAPSLGGQWECTPGVKEGAVGETTGLKTAGGLAYQVTTPASYVATEGHPLLIMHPGAGETASSFEEQTGMTPVALAAGYIVAYADHVSPVEYDPVLDAATIASEITERWCIDDARVYLAGNSDGATVISLNVIGDHIRPRPAGITLNAVGTSQQFLNEHQCGPQLITFIVHGSEDTVFPVADHGLGVADWWAGCESCDVSGTPEQGLYCRIYPSCGEGLLTEYCEVPLPHGHWPTEAPGFEVFNDRMLEVFAGG